MTNVAEARTGSVVALAGLHTLVRDVGRRPEPRTRVVSGGAGHDTSYMTLLAPAVMVLVSSIDGRSHSPEKNTLPERLALRVQARAEALIEVDRPRPIWRPHVP